MENERYKRGATRLNEVNPDGMDTLVRSLESIAPDLARYVIEFAYGDIYARPGLDSKQRELCIISALTALGNREVQLSDHIHAALNVGCTPEEIVETLLMMAVYAGFPAAINGMQTAKKILLTE